MKCFLSLLYLSQFQPNIRNPLNFFSGSIESGTGSTQPREDNWVAICYEKKRNPVKKTEIKVEGKLVANNKALCTAIWQERLRSILALRSCSATDLI